MTMIYRNSLLPFPILPEKQEGLPEHTAMAETALPKALLTHLQV